MLKALVVTYKWVFLITAFVLLLLGIRFFVGDHFRPGAEKNAIPALTGTNIVDISQIEQMTQKVMFVYLDDEKSLEANAEFEVSVFNIEDLLSGEMVEELKKFKSPKILVSEDPSVAARAWMILAQKGIENLFIFGELGDLENFDYSFKPEALTFKDTLGF
jgi:hypothetical protein